MPDSPSLPPHFMPRISSLAGTDLALETIGVASQLAHASEPHFDLVAHVLGVERLNALGTGRAHLLEKRRELVVFAAEPQDQDRRRVGVVRQARQDFLSVAEVVAELRAAVRVLERVHALDRRARAAPAPAWRRPRCVRRRC